MKTTLMPSLKDVALVCVSAFAVRQAVLQAVLLVVSIILAVSAVAGTHLSPVALSALSASLLAAAAGGWGGTREDASSSPRSSGVPIPSPSPFRDALRAATRVVPLHASGARVALVGAGPGSPDLLTIAAYDALRRADVVIADKIACPALHALIRPGAVLHVAGKIPGKADSAQEEVNVWGIAALRAGKRVVRLKAGDPYLFGRGGEEYQFYASHGYAPDVIPGVSSALVAPLVAGVPVTHRGVANSILVSTGQGRGGGFPSLPPFDAGRTLVLLMAVGRIPLLLSDLGGVGYPPHTPVAVVERATHADERVLRTTLSALAGDAARAGVTSPAVIVVGEAVGALSGAMADVVAAGLPLTFGPASGDVAGGEEEGGRAWTRAPAALTGVTED